MATRKYRNTFLLLTLPFITIVTVSMMILSPVFVAAASFPAKHEGYFYGGVVDTGVRVLTDTVTDGSSDSIPLYVNSKATLISYIEDLHYNSNTSNQNRIGADYIIQTMRSDGTTYDRTRPDDNDVKEWESIVTNYPGTITWNMSTAAAGINSSSINTYYSASDVHWYNSAGTASAHGVIVFTNTKGDKEYMIKRNCGNPLGVISGIANSTNYLLYPTISTPNLSANSVEEGSTIDVTANIYNTGNMDAPPTSALSTFPIPTTLYEFVVPQGSPMVDFTKLSDVSGYGTALNSNVIINGTNIPKDMKVSYYQGAGYSTSGASGCSWIKAYVPYSSYRCHAETSLTNHQYTYDNNASKISIQPVIDDPESYNAGDKVCWYVAVRLYSSDYYPNNSQDTHRRLSTPVCVTVAKKPKVQIHGGDLWVGVPFAGTSISSNIDTSTVTKGTFTFGSWIEYGIFATGIVKGAGSGSAYSGSGLDSANVCKESLLTYANTEGDGTTGCTDSTEVGKYATTRYMPDISASFSPDSSSVDIGSNDISNQLKTGVFTGSGQISLAGGTLQKGRWLVINAPSADITITGNIEYTDEVLKSIYDIPQLVIIAKNITIAESVTRIDAWLVAKGDSSGGGVLSTCTFTSSDPTTRDSFPAFPPFPGLSKLGLDINKCNQKLTINGPVMAQKLYLLRTAGSGTGAASGDPAEVFNLRPDAFLWALARSVVSGRLQTVYTTELPPRL